MPFILGLVAAFSTRAFWYAILGNIAVGLGVSVISYVGINTAIDGAIALMQSELGGLPADMAVVISLAKVPQGISVVLSACVARLTMMGLINGGALRRITWASNGPIVLN
jgi:hypothetical protein